MVKLLIKTAYLWKKFNYTFSVLRVADLIELVEGGQLYYDTYH
jgi:hypothetical protein